jgi:N-acylneuraminate cytidylyltransferase
MKKSIAIITARGGSKRIPKKNIKPFMGKPMLAYPINAALQSGLFDEVMVSTDCPEISQIALHYGARVPFMRSAATSNDFATTVDVLEEVLGEYKKMGCLFETTCCIYPCSPTLTSKHLQDAWQQLCSTEADSIMPVCRYSVPIEWAMKLENGVLRPADISAINIRSQDLIPKYYDAGMFYFMKTETLLKGRCLISNLTQGFILPESEVQDIDNEEDWKLAEMKYRIKNHV